MYTAIKENNKWFVAWLFEDGEWDIDEGASSMSEEDARMSARILNICLGIYA